MYGVNVLQGVIVSLFGDVPVTTRMYGVNVLKVVFPWCHGWLVLRVTTRMYGVNVLKGLRQHRLAATLGRNNDDIRCECVAMSLSCFTSKTKHCNNADVRSECVSRPMLQCARNRPFRNNEDPRCQCVRNRCLLSPRARRDKWLNHDSRFCVTCVIHIYSFGVY